MNKVMPNVLLSIFTVILTGCSGEATLSEMQTHPNEDSLPVSSSIEDNSPSKEETTESNKDKKRNSNAEKYAEIVLNNESEWLGRYTAYNLDGSPMCWFEDLDFDGKLEFIVGGAIWDTCDQGTVNYDFYRFTDDDKMVRLLPSYGDTCLMAANLDYNPGFGYIGGSIIKNKSTGQYSYIYSSSFFSYPAVIIKEMQFSITSYDERTLMGYSEIDFSDELPAEQYYGENEKEISKSELITVLQGMLNNYTLCRSKVGTIPFSYLMNDIEYGREYNDALSAIVSGCYNNLDENEKKQALINSYNSYQFQETDESPYIFTNMLFDLGVSPETEETPAEAAWKAAYIRYIDEYVAQDDAIREAAEFYFLDINGDSIPEIHIQSGFGYSGSLMLTYNPDNDTVTDLHEGNSSGVSFIKGKNIFDYDGGHMDVYYDHVYKIENNKFVLVAEGDYGATDNSHVEVDENGYPIYSYYWNNQQVSESEYQSKLNDLVDSSQAVSFYDAIEAYSYSEVVEKINSYR